MIQTYQGYFQEDGCFIPDGVRVRMPVKRRAIVNILEDEATGRANIEESAHQQKVLAIKEILADALKSENDLSDADWEEFAGLRAQTNAGLSRTVNI